jgi:1-deoxy-D-xylulose-5-phosphate synthase
VVTVEDGIRTGGVGTAVAQALRDAGVHTPVRELGVAPGWHPHGSRAEVLAAVGLTAQGVARAAIEAATAITEDAQPQLQ